MNRTIARLTLAMLAGTAIVASSPASASSYSVVYTFTGGGDAALPASGLLKVPVTSGSLLYGTTVLGGLAGFGTIYTIDPATGAETVVNSFFGSDGSQPSAALINVGGTLYGTTGAGGAHCGMGGCGTVFAYSPATGLNVVYSFQGAVAGDGALPFASLIKVGGKLYGTTEFGGATDNGTIFSIDLSSGAETVVYSFQGGSSDGALSIAGLTNVGGVLYGTTSRGGNSDNGTVFKFDPATGTESVVYAFLTTGDGMHPWAGLIKVGGKLYGATNAGGGTGCGGNGCGTVFSIDLSSGGETIVHAFTGADGQNPEASLVNVGGTLYGTTINGGISVGGATYGTIYSIDATTGAEAVLHSFGSGSDGRHPRTTLIDVGGTLYGTTEEDGAGGTGTVFAYTP